MYVVAGCDGVSVAGGVVVGVGPLFLAAKSSAAAAALPALFACVRYSAATTCC